MEEGRKQMETQGRRICIDCKVNETYRSSKRCLDCGIARFEQREKDRRKRDRNAKKLPNLPQTV